MSNREAGYGLLLRTVAASIEESDPDAAQALVRAASDVEEFISERAGLVADLERAEQERDEAVAREARAVSSHASDVANRMEIVRQMEERAEAAEAAVAAKDAALRDVVQAVKQRCVECREGVYPLDPDDERYHLDPTSKGGRWCNLTPVERAAIRAALAVGDATEPGYNLVHAAEFVDARNESSSVPGDATETPEISALASLVKDGVPLPEGTCPRCRGMGGIYVASNGGRTFVRCPECKGVPGDATETPRESIESYAKRSGWMNDPDVEPGVPGVVQTPEETP